MPTTEQDAAGVSAPTATRMLTGLGRAGLVERAGERCEAARLLERLAEAVEGLR